MTEFESRVTEPSASQGGSSPLPPALSVAQVERVLRGFEATASWLQGLQSPNKSLLALRVAYASAGRHLSSSAAGPQGIGAAHWSWLDWGRLWLLLNFLQEERFLTDAGAEEARSVVRALYERGEIGEQESLLRTLSALPTAALHVETAIEACRHSATRVFEAMACDNPYPAALFAPLNFNQLLLKAVFNELTVQRVVGWARRVTPELQRMASDAASERRAAGRAVPLDLDLIASHKPFEA